MSISGLYDQELLAGTYHPHVTFYYFKQWDDFQMPEAHAHHRVEIMYVISGQCKVTIDKDVWTMKKGQFVLIDAHVPHQLIVKKGKPCRMLNIEFQFEEKTGAFPSIKELTEENTAFQDFLTRKKMYHLLHDPNEVYFTLKNLVLELDEAQQDNQLMIKLLLSQLLIHIAKLAAAADCEDAAPANLYVKKTLDFIHHHYDCDIQVKDIAAAVHLHPNYLHRIFKAHTGSSVLEFLTSFRMEKAKMLLLHSSIPITDISEYIGINSRQYFSALFKKHTGQSPLEYRNSIDKWKREETEEEEDKNTQIGT
ncbi:AraC-type DNA-binding protein [Evansella caseinilytica]|uniref:AraC-type DNA-binding protein n=1 Tax=Evansella caseinilytica TaxID=1503961 RepID=A0A1H3RE56_9BACI|nr:AraC family transcriptional regulator [Evansella caseinilytica]SDZ23551.1 AraC-type DNA-binding protein [Evansella caseinilytica]